MNQSNHCQVLSGNGQLFSKGKKMNQSNHCQVLSGNGQLFSKENGDILGRERRTAIGRRWTGELDLHHIMQECVSLNILRATASAI
ncbi:hypothetical protein QE152_g10565 [Popillia japonica]|uniref:Uncharacterized protein n=1 Tax=Popillia japonica TaxID=7064 RepID=A0AAW1LT50_POPJA